MGGGDEAYNSARGVSPTPGCRVLSALMTYVQKRRELLSLASSETQARGNDECKRTSHCSVHPLHEPWAHYHVLASGRHGNFRLEQVAGGQTNGGGEQSGSGGVKRRERAVWLRAR